MVKTQKRLSPKVQKRLSIKTKQRSNGPLQDQTQSALLEMQNKQNLRNLDNIDNYLFIENKRKRGKQIKRTYIAQQKMNQLLRKGTNISKFIINSILGKNIKLFKRCYQQRRRRIGHFQNTKHQILRMIQQSNKVGTYSLKKLFGLSNVDRLNMRNYLNRKAMFRMLSKNLEKLTIKSIKIANVLTYSFCLEKYISRLVNPELMYKIQFR